MHVYKSFSACLAARELVWAGGRVWKLISMSEAVSVSRSFGGYLEADECVEKLVSVSKIW
jgi:hypothetical protein